MERIKPGIYEHFKGSFYEVIGEGRYSETMEAVVVYRQLCESSDFPAGYLWVRPLKMFLEEVEVNGQKIPRFKLVGESNESLLF